MEGKSAGAGPGPHTDGLRDLPCHLVAFPTGWALGPTPQATASLPQSQRLSYSPPHTAQETRGISSHLNHSRFTARNVLISQIQPY